MLILRLALRAIRWRAAASATVFVVAVVAIFAATVGPIYLHAVDETVLARHLKDASLSQRDVLVSRDSEVGYRGVDWDAQVRSLAGEVAHDHLFARPLSEEQVDVVYGGAEQLKSEIASVEDLCVHVRIIRGRCVSGNSTGETVISANTAAAEHLTVGEHAGDHDDHRGRDPAAGRRGVPPGRARAGRSGSRGTCSSSASPGRQTQATPGDASFVTSAALSSRVQRVSETLSANVALLPEAMSATTTSANCVRRSRT